MPWTIFSLACCGIGPWQYRASSVRSQKITFPASSRISMDMGTESGTASLLPFFDGDLEG